MVEDGEEEYRQLPRGVPTLTYARLLDPLPLSSLSSENNDKVSDKDDLEVDGDFVVVKEQGSALMRFPVAHVFPRGLSDQVRGHHHHHHHHHDDQDAVVVDSDGLM